MSATEDFFDAIQTAKPGEWIVYGVCHARSMGLCIPAQDAARAGLVVLRWKRIDGQAHAIAVRTDAPFRHPSVKPRSEIKRKNLPEARAAVAAGITATELAAQLGVKQETAARLMREARS